MSDWSKTLSKLELRNMTAEIMWILIQKFGMNSDQAAVSPDEKRGQFVISKILLGGKFGKYDKRYALLGHSKIGKNIQRLCRDAR